MWCQIFRTFSQQPTLPVSPALVRCQTTEDEKSDCTCNDLVCEIPIAATTIRPFAVAQLFVKTTEKVPAVNLYTSIKTMQLVDMFGAKNRSERATCETDRVCSNTIYLSPQKSGVHVCTCNH